jgi:RNA polymerase sigma-70 factor (ECF subfamily)
MLEEQFASTLAAAQAGADWAVADIYRSHNARVLRYLRANAPAEAEDLASETWLDAARNLSSFSGDEDAFRAWLFTIARRRLTDHRRRSGRRRDRAASAGALEPSMSITPSSEAQALAGRLGLEAAQLIVERLPADQAEVVLLRVVADLSVEQVSAITGRRPGTVRVLQHRALRRLAREIPDDV